MSTVQPEEGRDKQAAREHRTASLAHWEEAASGWVARQATLRELSAPVSHWMIDAVDPQPGQRVLELAAGLGETGFLAAEMVAPVGGVITSDQADAMLDGARKRAGELNLTNVEFQVLNAEWIDLPVASVDVVFCRWGYMLMVDPLAALTETRRVLRPEGHVALAVWDAIEHNPWALLPGAELAERGLIEPPARGRSGPVRARRQAACARPAGRRGLRRGVGGALEPDPARGQLRRVLGDDARHRACLPRRGALASGVGDRRHPRQPGEALRALHRRGRLA